MTGKQGEPLKSTDQSSAQNSVWSADDDLDRARNLLRDTDEKPGSPDSEEAPFLSDTPADEIETLYRVAREVGGTLDLDALLPKILDLALDYSDAERGILFQFDANSGTPQPRVARGMDPDDVLEARKYSLTILDETRNRGPIHSDDAQSDERFRDAESVSLHEIRAVICLPIGTADRVIGALYLDNLRSGRRLDRRAVRFAGILAGLAAIAITNAERYGTINLQNQRLRNELGQLTRFDEILGRSKPMVELLHTIERVAGTDFPVLLRGESGTGKELVARAIHRTSQRTTGPFIVQNCAAIPSELLESEFFGHSRGAFTGAHVAREGLFRLADGGTLFLDEIGDLDPKLQAKLLRVLEDGVVRPVGSVREHTVSFRLVSASSSDIERRVRDEVFREDLFYRLNVVVLLIPPLRERTDDIPVLLNHFLSTHAAAAGGRNVRISDGALQELQGWPWKGNVRELEHFAKRVLILADDPVVQKEDLSRFLQLTDGDDRPLELPVGRMTLAEMEAAAIEEAIRRTGGNKAKAAELLGIHRNALLRRLEKLAKRGD